MIHLHLTFFDHEAKGILTMLAQIPIKNKLKLNVEGEMTSCSAEACFCGCFWLPESLQKLVALQNTNWMVTYLGTCILCGQAAGR